MLWATSFRVTFVATFVSAVSLPQAGSRVRQNSTAKASAISLQVFFFIKSSEIFSCYSIRERWKKGAEYVMLKKQIKEKDKRKRG